MPADDLEELLHQVVAPWAGHYLTDTDLGPWKRLTPLVWDKEPTVEEIVRRIWAALEPIVPGLAEVALIESVEFDRSRKVRLMPRPGRGARQLMARGVPVVDISPLVGDLSGRDAAGVIARLDEACTQTGFFVCVGHGSEGDVATMLAAAPARCSPSMPTSRRGWRWPSAAATSTTAPRSCSTSPSTATRSAPNQWPPLDGFRPLVGRYQAQVLSVAETLLAALAVALGIERDFFAVRMRHPESYLRLLHYPPQPAGEVTTKPHTDYGALTLLATDGVGGLQVHPIGGPWVDVDAPAGSFVVNLGDMLARWTNDHYVSTPHQVVSRATVDRYSVPFFVNPDPDTVVECIPSCATAERPARYEPVTATRFLQGRIDGTIAVATP